MKKDKWIDCYEDGWKDVIVPEAFAHPAKFSYSLIQRIIGHAIRNEFVKRGDLIVDPFGGIGTGGIVAAYSELRWAGCELEEKFVRLADGYDCPGISKKEWVRWYNRFGRNNDICPNCQAHAQSWYEKNSGIIPYREPHHYIGNFELHRKKLEALNCPQPVIIQGDSRKLCEILSKADLIVSSPPFQEQQPLVGGEKLLAKVAQKHGNNKQRRDKHKQPDYGTTPGQLGAMKPGSADAVISSPPYSPEALGHAGKGNEIDKKKRLHARLNNDQYGQTPGNLGNLKPGKVDCVVSSPPWEGSQTTDASSKKQAEKGYWNKSTNKQLTGKYSEQDGQCSDANIANDQGDTFWQAAKEIVEQCYQILKPGGHAIWVTKRFIRKGKIVEFSQDWARLCESVGFEVVCWHHAMLVKKEKKKSLFGGEIVKEVHRKSFFRRLAEIHGSPPIDWEDVICMRKN